MSVEVFRNSIDDMIDKVLLPQIDTFSVGGGKVISKIYDEELLHDKDVLDKLLNEIECLEKPLEEELNELMKSDVVGRYIEADAKYRHLKNLGKQIEEIKETVPESIELMEVDEVKRYIEAGAKLRYSKIKKEQLKSYYIK